MNRILSIVVAAFAFCYPLFAQEQDTVAAPVDSVNRIPAATEYDNQIESMLNDFFISNAFAANCSVDDTANVSFPDSVYIERLQKMPCEMEMPFNNDVKKFIEYYARKRKLVSYMVGLGRSYYFSLFEQKLAAYGVPLELCYLPVIESALNARAVSRAGAAGLWQFMVGTGRMYGLEVNSLVDERRDPLKATDAAARYLRDLYKIYGDWHLVIAAYNCGPGNVAKAIRRAGGKSNYWAIYNYLPAETRSYVPIFIAANYIMNYYEEHGICPAKSKYTYATDTVMIADRVHLRQIADVTGLDFEELSFLNPQYKNGIIPGNIKKYPLVLPLAEINTYEVNRDSILAYKPDMAGRLETVEPGVGQRSTESFGQGSSSSQNSSGCRYHKVKKGDTLSSIARKYGTSVSQIQKWNRLRSTVIQIGQTLKIYK